MDTKKWPCCQSTNNPIQEGNLPPGLKFMGAGVWLSMGRGCSGVFGGRRSGKRNSFLALSCRPPPKRIDQVLSNAVSLFLLVAVCGIMNIQLALVCIVSVLISAVLEDVFTYEAKYKNWEASWDCKKCGSGWHYHNHGDPLDAYELTGAQKAYL